MPSTQAWPRSLRAALSFGCASPNPHPPSRSCAMIAPAHFPLLNPQQPDAQSASLLQGPVMNCVPGAVAGAGVVGGAGVEGADAPVLASPRSLRAALSLGWASPNPHPPSRSCAIIAPAHFPLLKPQQPDAQSASLLHGPVMNWVPGAVEGAGVVGADAPVFAVEPVLGPAGASPRSLRAALSFGWESPKPHPPSRSCAIIAPAHLPDLKPQQPEAQSTSPAQGPVMNCEPGAARGTYVAAATGEINAISRILDLA